jgi:N-acetylglucosamine-6-phosphate deacetylase
VAESLVLRGGTVLTAAGWADDCDVHITAGRIAAVARGVAAGSAETVDARGLCVVPGLLDVHVHGAGGAMFEDGLEDGVERISRTLATLGTTAMLATVAALPPDRLRAAAAAIARAAPHCAGARIVGIHLEGPFISPRRAGAQDAVAMRLPSLDELDAVQAACGGLIRMVTVAPELPGAIDFISAARARGLIVALGHSEATAEQCATAIAAGASHVTHLFNAAPPLHHRAPGMVGTALTDDRLSIELICDGHHVHRRAVDIALRCKPVNKVILVSDGVAAVGMPDGEMRLFGTACVVGDAVRTRSSGALAGSRFGIDQALRNLRQWFPSLPLERSLAWATSAPAALLGLTDGRAEVTPGAPADLALLDARLEVVAAVCRGRITRRA